MDSFGERRLIINLFVMPALRGHPKGRPAVMSVMRRADALSDPRAGAGVTDSV